MLSHILFILCTTIFLFLLLSSENLRDKIFSKTKDRKTDNERNSPTYYTRVWEKIDISEHPNSSPKEYESCTDNNRFKGFRYFFSKCMFFFLKKPHRKNYWEKCSKVFLNTQIKRSNMIVLRKSMIYISRAGEVFFSERIKSEMIKIVTIIALQRRQRGQKAWI